MDMIHPPSTDLQGIWKPNSKPFDLELSHTYVLPLTGNLPIITHRCSPKGPKTSLAVQEASSTVSRLVHQSGGKTSKPYLRLSRLRTCWQRKCLHHIGIVWIQYPGSYSYGDTSVQKGTSESRISSLSEWPDINRIYCRFLIIYVLN